MLYTTHPRISLTGHPDPKVFRQPSHIATPKDGRERCWSIRLKNTHKAIRYDMTLIFSTLCYQTGVRCFIRVAPETAASFSSGKMDLSLSLINRSATQLTETEECLYLVRACNTYVFGTILTLVPALASRQRAWTGDSPGCWCTSCFNITQAIKRDW